MKKITTSLVLIFVFNLVFTQVPIFQVKKEKTTESWGFVDPSGALIVEPKFKSVGSFNGELAWAKHQDGRCGYVNKKGEWVIEPIYEIARDFDPVSGLAKVKNGAEWGFINSKGEFAKVTFADDCGDFSEGLCWARKDKLCGFINNKFEWILAPKFTKVKDFKGGYVRVEENGLWGILDVKGIETCAPKFKALGAFINDVAWAKLTDGKGGFINPKGEWIIEPIYDVVRDFDPISGLAKVKIADNWGFINRKAEFKVFSQAEDFGEFNEGLCWARKDKLCGFINSQYEWVVAPTFTKVKDCKDGYCLVLDNLSWGIIDSKGNTTCTPKFAAIDY